MTRIKKFFSPELRTYNQDLTKRWRVEYWEPGGPGIADKRITLYGEINKSNTVEGRKRIANELINTLSCDKPEKEKNILDKVLEAGSISWRPKTLSAYTTVVDKYISFLGRKKKPETSTEEIVNNFLLSEHQKGTNPNTISKYRNTLFTLYEKAIAAKLCAFNPVKKVPTIKRAPTSLMYFSDKQITAIREEAGAWSQLWMSIQFLFYCFIRPGEQRHMRISWINLEYGFIEIPAEFSKNKKTQKVSIPAALMPSIQHLCNYPNNFYVLSKTGYPGIEQISTKYLNDKHKAILNKLKIRGRFAFYSWKHTGVVKAVGAGIHIKDLQMQLRHHSLDMVNEYLKDLGVTDSHDLKYKFPSIEGFTAELAHKSGCTCNTLPEYNYCPECGVKLKIA